MHQSFCSVKNCNYAQANYAALISAEVEFKLIESEFTKISTFYVELLTLLGKTFKKQKMHEQHMLSAHNLIVKSVGITKNVKLFNTRTWSTDHILKP